MGFIYLVIWFQSNGPVFLYSPLSVTGSPLYDLLGLMLSNSMAEYYPPALSSKLDAPQWRYLACDENFENPTKYY